MCDDDDEEVMCQGADLCRYLLANGLCDFEVHKRPSRRTELNLHIKKVESKYRAMSFLNFFIPYRKCNMSLVQEIRGCHLLLEEDALYLESLYPIDVEEPSSFLQTAGVGAAVAWPMMLLCHVPCKKVFTITLAGLGLLSIRQMIGIVRQKLDQNLMCALVSALKGFSAICRKSQSLVQEWEVIAGNMNILKDTSLLRAKMCGIDDLKEDLVKFLRLCVINLTESSRDIVNISTGNDLHPLCMEVMRSEVMLEQSNTISKAKKLHYLFVLVQSDFLKNIAVSFMSSSKSVPNIAACAATVKNCISYTTQYIEECTRILTQKYEILINYTPQAKMTKSIYKHCNRTSTFGDVRQTVNNITVCLEALTLQSLLVQRALERYDENVMTNPSRNVTEIEKVCSGTEDALLGLQTDLHAAQCSIELAVKQLAKLRKSDQEKRSKEQAAEVQSGILTVHKQLEHKQIMKLEDIPGHIRDEVFELCDKFSNDECEDSNINHNNLHDIIQKRAEQRVAGRLIKELKIALMSKRAEMMAREEIARNATSAHSCPISTQTYEQEDTPSEMIASIMDNYNEETFINDSPRSQSDLEISDRIINPNVHILKPIKGNDGSTSTITSECILAQTGSLFLKSNHAEGDTKPQNDFNPNKRINTHEENLKKSSQVLQVVHNDNEKLCRGSSLESLYLDHEYSDLSFIKDDLVDGASTGDQESEYEFNFMCNDYSIDTCGYTDLKLLPKSTILLSGSSEEDSDSSIHQSTTASVKSEELTKPELPILNGDYLLNDIPERAKPPNRRPCTRNHYRYEPESGDNEEQSLIMGFKLPNEAVIKAREMNLIGTEECFENTD